MTPPARHVVVIGAGVVGLSAAYYARRRGFEVTVVDREGPERATTSYGNAGLIVPSHFVPLAAPGAVAQGIRWMFDPESPFYVRPTLDPALVSWGYRFWRASTPTHVERSAQLLRDLNRAGHTRYQELAECFGDVFDLRQRGLLMLCNSERGLEHEAVTAATARTLDIPAEMLDRAGVQALEPGVDLAVVGAAYYPEDAQLDPGRFMTALQASLVGDGVRFLWHTEVEGLQLHGRRVTGLRLRRAAWSASPDAATIGPTLPGQGTTDRAAGGPPSGPSTSPSSGTTHLDLDDLVLAAGIWSQELATALHLRLPMRAGKGYSLTLANPTQPLATPAILSEAHVAVTPLAGALRFGGTMEVTTTPRAHRTRHGKADGSGGAGGPGGGRGSAGGPGDGGRDGPRGRAGASQPEQAAATSSRTGLPADAARRVHGITAAVGRYLPAYPTSTFAGVPVWYGFRPTSPDGLPYLGRSPGQDNVVIATGHAMMGMSLGPVSGAVAAELLVGDPPSVPIDALRPDRFSR